MLYPGLDIAFFTAGGDSSVPKAASPTTKKCAPVVSWAVALIGAFAQFASRRLGASHTHHDCARWRPTKRTTAFSRSSATSAGRLPSSSCSSKASPSGVRFQRASAPLRAFDRPNVGGSLNRAVFSLLASPLSLSVPSSGQTFGLTWLKGSRARANQYYHRAATRFPRRTGRTGGQGGPAAAPPDLRASRLL